MTSRSKPPENMPGAPVIEQRADLLLARVLGARQARRRARRSRRASSAFALPFGDRDVRDAVADFVLDELHQPSRSVLGRLARRPAARQNSSEPRPAPRDVQTEVRERRPGRHPATRACARSGRTAAGTARTRLRRSRAPRPPRPRACRARPPGRTNVRHSASRIARSTLSRPSSSTSNSASASRAVPASTRPSARTSA